MGEVAARLLNPTGTATPWFSPILAADGVTLITSGSNYIEKGPKVEAYGKSCRPRILASDKEFGNWDTLVCPTEVDWTRMDDEIMQDVRGASNDDTLPQEVRNALLHAWTTWMLVDKTGKPDKLPHACKPQQRRHGT
ncbi:hypothetical protein TI39_contig94g00001 [Zymoseptoria brevis]|uniref:Uncharacterized protein n=1 Tax=Zymoseptoria brevis TaxID=1047168 RepID=A0A0F4GY32_9PEZI|nr:hypothetical protein TI39_contig94g00001 [Zymoseptoria brevis]